MLLLFIKLDIYDIEKNKFILRVERSNTKRNRYT